MDLMVPSSYASHGMLLAHLTRKLVRVEGEFFLIFLIKCPFYAELLLSSSNYATMRFAPESDHDANAGLKVAREVMEKVKQEFDWISYGDLWTLGGVAAIQVNGCHQPSL